jgi:hypothetical protein
MQIKQRMAASVAADMGDRMISILPTMQLMVERIAVAVLEDLKDGI